MDQEFQIVIITYTRFLPGEAEMLSLLLGGLDCRVHLRKPGCTERQMRGLIEALPEEFRPELTLQDHLSLAPEYGVGGALGEVAMCRDADYVFLSPVFDSISKSGYSSAFTDAQLRSAPEIDGHVYALGGVRPEHFPLLAEYGFGGAALLGHVWRDCSPEGMRKVIGEIKSYV